MSAQTFRAVVCDSTNCNAYFDGFVDVPLTQIRRDAKALGWRVSVPDPKRPPANNARLDFCPYHARDRR